MPFQQGDVGACIFVSGSRARTAGAYSSSCYFYYPRVDQQTMIACANLLSLLSLSLSRGTYDPSSRFSTSSQLPRSPRLRMQRTKTPSTICRPDLFSTIK